MVPTLALGIPGSGSTALILAALIMHGFRPGPYLLNETPEFLYAIFGAMLFANVAFLAIGLAGAKFFSLVTFIPKQLLWPAVFIFAVIGAYSSSSSFVDVYVMLVAWPNRLLHEPTRFRCRTSRDGINSRKNGRGSLQSVHDYLRQQLPGPNGEPNRSLLLCPNRRKSLDTVLDRVQEEGS